MKILLIEQSPHELVSVVCFSNRRILDSDDDAGGSGNIIPLLTRTEMGELTFGSLSAILRAGPSGAYDPQILLDGFGEAFEGVGLTRRLHPCCIHTQRSHR
jgi:hypothetical protein